MNDKYDESCAEEESIINQAYVKLWGRLQGPLHPYVKKLQPLVGRSLVDAKFRERLMTESDAVFKEAEIKFEKGVSVKVVEDSQNIRHLVLPPLIQSIPARRMNVFNRMLSSGSLNAWGSDDSDGPDVARSAGVPTGSDGTNQGDPSTDSWHPF